MIHHEHIKTQQSPPTYQKQLLQKIHLPSRIRTYPHAYQHSNPITPISHTESTQSTGKSNAYYIYDEGYDKKNMKKLLYEDYEAQLKMKRQRNNLQQVQERQLEKKLLKKTQEIHAHIQWHDYEQKMTKQRQLSQDYHNKQQLKRQSKFLEEEQKSKQRMELQNKKPINKRAIFEEFFTNCDKGMKMNSKMYLDKVIPIEHKREVEKDKLTEAGINKIADKYSNMYQNIQSQNEKKLSEFRAELTQQKQQNQQMRRYNSQKRIASYPHKDRIEYHDPIINPVNLGVNPQNKYVVAQIRKNIERSGSSSSRGLMGTSQFNNALNPEGITINMKGLSQLARNGSHLFM